MNPDETSQRRSSRRKFIELAAAGAAVAVMAEGTGNFAGAPTVLAQSNLSPGAALEELLAGNRRFTSGNMASHEHDLTILKQKTVEKQEPFAAVLSCADSRVPVELVFDQSIGHLFVTRIAGNMVTSEVIASLEYGVAVLGTKAILVMGHGNCGAVKATIEGKQVPGQISALYPHIQPAVDEAGPDLEAATRANARIQARLLREASPVIGQAVKQDKLKVAAGYYNIASGAVTIL